MLNIVDKYYVVNFLKNAVFTIKFTNSKYCLSIKTSLNIYDFYLLLSSDSILFYLKEVIKQKILIESINSSKILNNIEIIFTK